MQAGDRFPELGGRRRRCGRAVNPVGLNASPPTDGFITDRDGETRTGGRSPPRRDPAETRRRTQPSPLGALRRQRRLAGGNRTARILLTTNHGRSRTECYIRILPRKVLRRPSDSVAVDPGAAMCSELSSSDGRITAVRNSTFSHSPQESASIVAKTTSLCADAFYSAWVSCSRSRTYWETASIMVTTASLCADARHMA